ncbi:MAG: ROK family protein [Acidobacteria bacterium]|nr:ROK family protein [Acidobacteriota bacterium]
MRRSFACVAIGGTKCSVSLASCDNDAVQWLARHEVPTHDDSDVMVAELSNYLAEMLRQAPDTTLTRIGIVCGGPLDEMRGLVLSPPNLPGWVAFDIVTPLTSRFNVPVRLMNDASASALAEWVWGAARGTRTCVFLTMGTGMGAGLIVSGRLHRGINGSAGEVGHWRLASNGPWGFGKYGSFEGFCSGGGIALWAASRVREALAAGRTTLLSPDGESRTNFTAHSVAIAALAGDPLARELWADVGERLGATLALMVDLLNPEVIAIGGIFSRQEELLRPNVDRILRREALATSLASCTVVPAQLEELIGDYAALATALVGENFDTTARQISAAVSYQ